MSSTNNQEDSGSDYDFSAAAPNGQDSPISDAPDNTPPHNVFSGDDDSMDEDYLGSEVDDNMDDEINEEEDNEDDNEDNDDEDAGQQLLLNLDNLDEDDLAANPTLLSIVRQLFAGGFLRAVGRNRAPREPEPEPEPVVPSTPSPDIMSQKIAEQIIAASKSLDPNPAKSIRRMVLQREINVRPAFSVQTRTEIMQRNLPIVGAPMFEYDDQIFCGQFSQQGDVYMSACQGKHLRLYNTDTWKKTKDIAAREIGWSIISTDYSPDQKWLIYSSWSDNVHLCNVHGEFEIHDALDFSPQAQRFCLFSIKFAPDSNFILGGSSDNHIYLFDLIGKKRTLRVPAHDHDVNTVTYMDNTGNIIATGSDDTLGKLWDIRILGKPSEHNGCIGVLVGHTEGITHVSPKGDGRYLISNGKDQCIKLWDIRNMSDPSIAKSSYSRSNYDYRYGGIRMNRGRRHSDDKSIMTYKGHSVFQTLIRAYFSPASTGQRYIYSGSSDGNIHIYDVLSGSVVKKLSGHRSLVRDVSWHPYKTQIVSTSWDGTVWRWEVEDDINTRQPKPTTSRARARRFYM